MNNLQWLQEWLLKNCYIDSDHFYCISIETIDNPGWHIRIQLEDTILNKEVFEKTVIQREDEDDWLHCKVENGVFDGNCGPRNLEEIILVFRKWVSKIEQNIE